MLVVRNYLFARIDQANDAFMIRRQPRGRFLFPLGNVWSTDEIYVIRRKGLMYCLIPGFIDFLIVIDKTYEIALASRDTGIQRCRPALHWFEKVAQACAKLLLPLINDLSRVVFGIIIDDSYCHGETMRNDRTVQALQANGQKARAIVSWNNDV